MHTIFKFLIITALASLFTHLTAEGSSLTAGQDALQLHEVTLTPAELDSITVRVEELMKENMQPVFLSEAIAFDGAEGDLVTEESDVLAERMMRTRQDVAPGGLGRLRDLSFSDGQAIVGALNKTPGFVNAILENGMVDSARLIRTGQVHEQNMSEAEFRAVFCQNLITLVQCDERLMIDVRVFDSFNDVEFDPPLTPGGNLNDMNNFDPGTAGDIILVRAFYVWDGMTPIIGQYISNMAGGNRLVVSSAAFRNEPFDQILPSN